VDPGELDQAPEQTVQEREHPGAGSSPDRSCLVKPRITFLDPTRRGSVAQPKRSALSRELPISVSSRPEDRACRTALWSSGRPVFTVLQEDRTSSWLHTSTAAEAIPRSSPLKWLVDGIRTSLTCGNACQSHI
jgi:hypothetical protein